MKTILENTTDCGSSAYFGESGDWLIACSIHRDSDCLSRSNFEVMQSTLNALPSVKNWEGENHPVSVERFSHWAVGWIDYLAIHPNCAEAIAEAEKMRARIEDYPVLDETHFSNMEMEEANQVWRDCYSAKERIAYIREHGSQFEFHDFADLLGCVRGNYFAGYASELLS